MEENQKNFKYCDICKSQATLCNYYCDSCYKMIHGIKENNNHKKEKIDFFVPIETRCPQHPKVELNLFCFDEKGNNIYIINI